VGESIVEVIIYGVSSGLIVMLVVPDDVQRPDVIMGYTWLNAPIVAYHKTSG